jgi:hypothetical protein
MNGTYQKDQVSVGGQSLYKSEGDLATQKFHAHLPTTLDINEIDAYLARLPISFRTIPYFAADNIYIYILAASPSPCSDCARIAN